MRFKKSKINFKSSKFKLISLSGFIVAFAGIGAYNLFISQAASGYCSTSNVIGQASSTITIPESSQYHVWARIQVPDTNNSGNLNGARIEITGASNQCFILTTTSNSAVSGWQWINSDATAASTKLITSNMNAGSYTIKVLGLRDGVKVDKIILSKASDNCVPSNIISGSVMPGDNCTTPKPVVNITANPSTLTSGNSSVISWNSTDATSCTASGGSNGWSGTRATAGSFNTGNLTSSQTYTMVCSGIGGSGASRSTTITVSTPPAPTITFVANPTTITSGSSSVLSWSSTNSTSCTASGVNGWSGTKSTSGNQSTGTLTSSRTYSLSCTGSGGTTTANPVVVTVNSAPLVNDNEKPSITMDLPGVTIPSGETELVVGDLKSVTWQPIAADNVGVQSLSVTVNNQPVSLTNGSYTFGSQTNGNGDYTLRAVVTDTNGNTTESTLTIKLRHPDINRDNIVNSRDFNGLFRNWGSSSTNYDLNADGRVNSRDFNILFRNWGSI